MEQFRVQHKFEYEWTDEFDGDMEEVRSVIDMRRKKYPKTEYRVVDMSGVPIEFKQAEAIVALHNLEIDSKDFCGGWLNPCVTEAVLGSGPDDDPEAIKMEDLTCYECCCRDHCKWADDLYNTDGDCLAMK
jgi:hypothetical protein